jgi:hypothetical protein
LANHSTRIGFLFISIDWFFSGFISGLNYQKYAVKKAGRLSTRPEIIHRFSVSLVSKPGHLNPRFC